MSQNSFLSLGINGGAKQFEFRVSEYRDQKGKSKAPNLQRRTEEKLGQMGVGDSSAQEEISDLARDFHHTGDGSTCTRRGPAQHQRRFR